MLRKRMSLGLIPLLLILVMTIFSFADGVAESVENHEIYIDDHEICNEKLIEYFWRPYRFEPDLFGVHKWFYDNNLPENLDVELQYDQYPLARNFGVALNEGVYVREHPRMDSKILIKKPIYSKLDIIGTVYGEYIEKWKTNSWYEVEYSVKGEKLVGYAFSAYLDKRSFRYEDMIDQAKVLASVLEGETIGYINNYKNRNGKAPKRLDIEADAYGYGRDQSAPAYYDADIISDFRYMSDGRLVVIKEELPEFYKCIHPYFEGIYYIPKKFVHIPEIQNAYNQFIIVDRINQTEIALERNEDRWVMVSQNLVTTGEKAQFKDETELGPFQIIEKRSKFIYLDDVTKEIDGYAPFALRFNGGAYTHGVPVNFKKVLERVLKVPEVKNELGVVVQAAVYEEKVKELVDPGNIEYLRTIGTIPRSHKCVRHHTSTALFLYNWARIGEAAMIVME